MDIKDLELLNKLPEIKEWVSKDWTDEDWEDAEKQAEAKMLCMEYIEPFIEIEDFINDRDNLEKLTNYFYKNLSIDSVKNIKRMYEETKRFVGFNSLEFNFFIDDIMDEMSFLEVANSDGDETEILIYKTLNALLGKK